MTLCRPVSRGHWASVELVCRDCGRSWEPRDEVPVCTVPSRKERTKAIADRELRKIREILKGQPRK